MADLQVFVTSDLSRVQALSMRSSSSSISVVMAQCWRCGSMTLSCTVNVCSTPEVVRPLNAPYRIRTGSKACDGCLSEADAWLVLWLASAKW